MANHLLQKLNNTLLGWQKWKHYLFLARVFVLGILVGRLLVDRRQQVAGIVLVLIGMATVMLSQHRSNIKDRDGPQQ